jgi:hypothetical protein
MEKTLKAYKAMKQIEESFQRAKELRLERERTLFAIWEEENDLAQMGDTEAPDRITYVETEISMLDNSFWEKDTPSISRWWTRNDVSDIELGAQFEEITWSGDESSQVIFDKEMDNTWWEEQFQVESAEKVLQFDSITEARDFVVELSKAQAKGDHTREIIKTWSEGPKETRKHCIRYLQYDPNWEHIKGLSEARNRHLKVALRKVETAKSKQALQGIIKIAKRYSRDAQVRKEGKLKDGDRKVGIGFDYKRYAILMNSITEKAEALSLDGEWKRYPIHEFEKETPAEKDIYDGCARQGEFLGEAEPLVVSCPSCGGIGIRSDGLCPVCKGKGGGLEHIIREGILCEMFLSRREKEIQKPRVQSWRLPLSEIEDWLNTPLAQKKSRPFATIGDMLKKSFCSK